ncbi:hypothetical protein M011DRAFT_162185 [Sporormia fimetaria CBS 119925]|uniref:Uncharacterized protein n=1 Tax=Sporormia fimetaria CBS 119925 TaxID=1340428 RepID=A0A6A6V4G9_9PLEO|nr:hypothetical protein M011DRAFT_162185 [Sporormia fimetaria CBS 119925]
MGLLISKMTPWASTSRPRHHTTPLAATAVGNDAASANTPLIERVHEKASKVIKTSPKLIESIPQSVRAFAAGIARGVGRLFGVSAVGTAVARLEKHALRLLLTSYPSLCLVSGLCASLYLWGDSRISTKAVAALAPDYPCIAKTALHAAFIMATWLLLTFDLQLQPLAAIATAISRRPLHLDTFHNHNRLHEMPDHLCTDRRSATETAVLHWPTRALLCTLYCEAPAKMSKASKLFHHGLEQAARQLPARKCSVHP